MRKILSFFLVMLMLITVGCQQSTSISEHKNAVNDEYSAKAEVLLDNEVKAVKALDLEGYLQNINSKEQELIIEQTNWFNDLKLEPIDDFSLKLIGIEKTDDSAVVAHIEQSYKRGSENFKIELYKRLDLIDNELYDSGNYFEETSNQSFTVKYTDKNNKVADELIQGLQPIYDEFVERWKVKPDRKVVIKLFDDKELLRQSIKLSMWQCAGWYEYGESVRMYIDNNNTDVERLKGVIRHELVHMFTMAKANGNVAYWLAEGLAMNYQDAENNFDFDYQIKNTGREGLLTIEALESMELEKLEDRAQIRKYYQNSQLIICFVVNKYGEQAVDNLLIKLSEMPSQKGTAHENDKVYREYLHKVLPEVLGLKDYSEFIELWKQEIGYY